MVFFSIVLIPFYGVFKGVSPFPSTPVSGVDAGLRRRNPMLAIPVDVSQAFSGGLEYLPYFTCGLVRSDGEFRADFTEKSALFHFWNTKFHID